MFRAEPPREAKSSLTQKSTATGAETPIFTYDELNGQANEIRLLRILPPKPNSRRIDCVLFHVNLDDRPAYKALSYTWGSESDLRRIIYLDDIQFEVRESLWHALTRFQAGNIAPVIWIDAICINQSSDRERNHQVARMKTIYEQATEVVVWLGPAYERSDLAIRLVQELYERRKSTKRITERFGHPDIESALKALDDLFNRGYWRRIWIVQELTVARKITFYCGESEIDSESLNAVQALFQAMRTLDRFPRDILLNVLQKTPNITPRLRFHGIMKISTWKKKLASTNPSFFSSLLHHFDQLSSDPRDMIYGLAGLANQTSGYPVEVDYKLSATAVFRNFAKQEIEFSRKLDIICWVHPDGCIPQMPSWVPNWSATGYDGSHVFIFHPDLPQLSFSAAGKSTAITAFSTDRIRFMGLNIGSVELLSPPNGMKTHHDTLEGYLTLFNLTKLILSWNKLSSRDYEAFSRVLIMDQSEKEHYGWKTKSEFLLALFGYIHLIFAERNWIEKKSNSKLLAHWESWGCADPLAMRCWVDIWILPYIWDRRFFISSSKAMGLALENIKEGDLICIPLGCYHPVILRKVEEHYINLGEAYVDGYMYGEAMEMLERGELSLEEFELW